jgi:PAS domain-containing protein
VISHQNHTDRYLAEESLRASEVQFRMLAENMVDMVWKADKDMRFTYINDADRRVRGFETR